LNKVGDGAHEKHTPKTRTFLPLLERTEGRANNSQRYGQPDFSHDGACL